MKTFYKFYFLLFLLSYYSVSAQTITGNLINQNGDGLPGVQLKLYIHPEVYTAESLWDGSFVFNNITSVKKEQLPTGYSVSNNYPNPFNPKTRIEFTMPANGIVRIELYNILGQKIRSDLQRNYSAGNNYADLELNGLANGIYIAKITFNNKYSAIRKLMLLYGSQHLSASAGISGIQVNKTAYKVNEAADTKIDSLVVAGSPAYKKTFTNLPAMQGSELALGGLRVITSCPGLPTVECAGKTYNTVLIGNRCWFKDNIDVGKMTLQPSSSLDSIIVKQCYQNDSMNCVKYGGLYNYYEATLSDGPMILMNPQGICPDGWHVPSMGEFGTLTEFVNSDGNKLKREDQGIGKGTGTNESGFSALFFSQPGNSVNFASYWSSSGADNHHASCFELTDTGSAIYFSIHYHNYMHNVRCIKDYDSAAVLPERLVLNSPPNKATGLTVPVNVTWFLGARTTAYTLQVSEDSSFATFVYNQSNITETFKLLTNLSYPKKYFWRVSASNNYGVTQYSQIRCFTTSSAKDTRCPGLPTVTDTRDGRIKIYNTVKIGAQCWLKENIDVGTMIPGSTRQTNNGSIEKYCFNNDTANCSNYGGLYQWDEAMQYVVTEKARGICPDGWHVPAMAEFIALKNEVNGNANALKAYGQGALFGLGTNESGFSALLAGTFNFGDGHFYELGYDTQFWSSTLDNSTVAGRMFLYGNENYIYLTNSDILGAYSIRCIKDGN